MAVIHDLLEENNGVLKLGGKVVERGRILGPDEREAGANYQARFYSHGHRFAGINDRDVEPNGVVFDEKGNCWDERWLFATNPIIQVGAAEDEGLSWIVDNEGLLVGTLLSAIREDPAALLGSDYVAKMNMLGWSNERNEPMFELLTKFLDMGDHINAHSHPLKDEMYVVLEPNDPAYPLRLGFNRTFTARADVDNVLRLVEAELDRARRIERTNVPADHIESRLLDAMRNYNINPGTSVYVDRGMPHAPVGSVLELQRPMDDYRLWQLYHSVLRKQFSPGDMLRGNDDLTGLLTDTNWAKCFLKDYAGTFFYDHESIPSPSADGAEVKWVAHPNRSQYWSGKNITIIPGEECTVKEAGAYGLLVHQGTGKVNNLDAQGGNFRKDEFFVTAKGGEAGTRITNTGTVPMVVYQLFPRGVHSSPLIYDQDPLKTKLMEAGLRVGD